VWEFFFKILNLVGLVGSGDVFSSIKKIHDNNNNKKKEQNFVSW